MAETIRRPARRGDLLHIAGAIAPAAPFHHNCGGLVAFGMGVGCTRCMQAWKLAVFEAFTDEQLGERFYVLQELPDSPGEPMVLAWVEVEKRRFLRRISRELAETSRLEVLRC